MKNVNNLIEYLEKSVEPIPEDFPCGMWETTAEEQKEIDAVIEDLGIEF